MRRSTFIYLSIVGSATLSVSSLACNNRNAALNKVLRQPHFLSHICDAKTLKDIGKAYKERFRSEAKENELVDVLLTDSTGRPLSQTAAGPIVSSLLNRKIQQDFEAGRTIVVNGWILSQTEAQQCALFSIS